MGTKTNNYKPQYITGSFDDYLGRQRYFIICALSMPCFTVNGKYHVMDKDIIDTNETVIKRFTEAMKQVPEELYHSGFIEIKRPTLDNPVCGEVVREVRFGVALLRANEEFNELLGREIAYGKALKSKLSMYVTDKRLISQSTIDALLKQQAEYIIENPEEYIKPYAEEKVKWVSENPCKTKPTLDEEVVKNLDEDLPLNEEDVPRVEINCCNGNKCGCWSSNEQFTTTYSCTDVDIQDVEYVEVKSN